MARVRLFCKRNLELAGRDTNFDGFGTLALPGQSTVTAALPLDRLIFGEDDGPLNQSNLQAAISARIAAVASGDSPPSRSLA
jgi:hypothetical protein